MNYLIRTIGFLGCFYFLSAVAQNNSLYNIRLKSGVLIKCELIKVIPDSIVVIRQYGMVSTIKSSEILSIEFSESIIRKESRPVVRKQEIKFKNVPDPGWNIGFQLCLGPYTAYETDIGISSKVRLSVLRRLDKSLEAGFAFGVDVYVDDELLFVPVLGEVRCYFEKDKPRSWFIYAQAGYGFNISMALLHRPGSGSNIFAGFGNASRTKKQKGFAVMVGVQIQNDDVVIDYDLDNGYKSVFDTMYGAEVRVEWRF